MAPFRNADALVHVLRLFRDESVPHPKGSIDPARDSCAMEEEMILADLGVAERRLERLEKDRKKSASAELKKEQELLLRCRSVLESGEPLRVIELERENAKRFRGFQFLSAKPLLLVLNIDEADSRILFFVESGFSRTTKTLTVVVCAKIELEIAQLEPADAAAFLADLGLAESGLDRVIRASYDLLGYISFFTVGADECRAWSIPRGTPAQIAAGEIHSDIARGFIRAEVVRYEDLIARGSIPACRDAGELRLEGKDYIVRTATSSISGSPPDGAPRQRLDRHPRLRGRPRSSTRSSPRWPTPRPGARFSSSTTVRPIRRGARAKAAGARVIRHPYNKGNGAAVKTGIRQAAGEYIIILDADGQHGANDAVRIAELLGEYHFVVGARDPSTHATLIRRLGNAGLNWLSSFLAGRDIPDLTSGLRGARRECLCEFLHLLPNGFSTPTTTTLAFLRAGYNVVFVPIAAAARVGIVENTHDARRGQILPDPRARDDDLQPDAHLPSDQRRLVRARRRLRGLDDRHPAPHHKLVGASDPLFGRRLSRRARVRTDFRAPR